ncbi:hypothetical protein ES695_10395 [Candidatus Atribacteria bacterium 1244-E10-H5-B2]|nr:MAG: hypothetical protein ES695_10395 [Candidatus Atribacteria bacterium 1244-E10-H5-B2]
MSESNGNGLSSRERNLLGLQSGKEEEEISTYLNSLDRTDLLLIRDTYYLFLGKETKQGKVISKLIENIKIKGGFKSESDL